jgi:rhodanese-related sulfurtransferase
MIAVKNKPGRRNSVVVQITIILLVSVAVALVYCAVAGSPLEIFEKFDSKKLNRQMQRRVELLPTQEEINVKTLQNLLANEMVLIFDTRSAEEYKKGHIPGAINLRASYSKEDSSIDSILLTRKKTIVIYGEVAQDNETEDLVQKFMASHFSPLLILKEGLPGWIEAGYAIETE